MNSKSRSKSKKHRPPDEPKQETSSWLLTPLGFTSVIGLAGVFYVLIWILVLGPDSGGGHTPPRETTAAPAEVPAAPAERVETTESNPDTLEIPLASLPTGQARHFEYVSAQGPIRFIAIKMSETLVRTALDECETCDSQRSGYVQSGDQMFCRTCGSGVPIGLVGGQSGGCNPIHLHAALHDDHIDIKVGSLVSASKKTRGDGG